MKLSIFSFFIDREKSGDAFTLARSIKHNIGETQLLSYIKESRDQSMNLFLDNNSYKKMEMLVSNHAWIN